MYTGHLCILRVLLGLHATPSTLPLTSNGEYFTSSLTSEFVVHVVQSGKHYLQAWMLPVCSPYMEKLLNCILFMDICGKK